MFSLAGRLKDSRLPVGRARHSADEMRQRHEVGGSSEWRLMTLPGARPGLSSFEAD